MVAEKVVYTASMGNMDYLWEPCGGGYDDVDFICFTDDPEIWSQKDKSLRWEIRHMPRKWPAREQACKEAKWYKVHSHLVVPEYEQSLWLDCCLQLKNLVDGFNKMGENLCLLAHPSRKCLYQEAARVMISGKGHPVRVAKQIGRYAVMGWGQAKGLWKGGVLWRNNTPDVAEFNKVWWAEIMAGSIRDQISLPIALHKSGIKYQTFPRGTPNLIGQRHYRRPDHAKTHAMQWQN